MKTVITWTISTVIVLAGVAMVSSLNLETIKQWVTYFGILFGIVVLIFMVHTLLFDRRDLD